MGENGETIHKKTTSFVREAYVLLLFIPSIVFVLFLSFATRPQTSNSNLSGNTILGEEESLKQMKIGDTLIDVTVAKSVQEKQKGLGGRTELAVNEGMLFDFGDTGPYSIWMKGMIIPIDIIFIKDERVTTIHKNAQPQPEVKNEREYNLYIPNEPVNYVVEVNAGFTDRNGIEVGDSVDFMGALK